MEQFEGEELLDAIRDNEKELVPLHTTASMYSLEIEEIIPDVVGVRVDDDPADGIEVIWKYALEPHEKRMNLAELYEAGYLHPDVPVGYDYTTLKSSGKIAIDVGTQVFYIFDVIFYMFLFCIFCKWLLWIWMIFTTSVF